MSKPRNRAADYKLDLAQHQHIEVANEGKHDDDDDDDDDDDEPTLLNVCCGWTA